MSLGGYVGRILRVNLTTGKTGAEPLEERDTELFLGGRGLGAALLYRELPVGTEPLSPQNKLIFTTGPLGATLTPGSSKYVVTTKSPLTGIYLMSVSSRDFGSQLKKAGYDVLIVEGRAAKPVYLHITDGQVEIRDAGMIWGMTTDRADWFLTHEELHDPQVKVACIGPAGENQVPYAGILNEGRAAGRGGAGAVMGAKNLKAIAIHGTGQTPLHDPDAFARIIKEAYRELGASPRTTSFRRYGTGSSIDANNKLGILPVKNWQQAYWPQAAGLSAQVMRDKYLLKSTLCVPCVSHCSKLTLVRDGPYAGAFTEGPEYETLYSLGSCCGISEMDAVIAADALCDQLGLDSMSAGVSLAFAMECFEKGILTEKDTGGIKLTFGNHQALGQLLHQMAYKDGFGALLALGVRGMAQRLGQGSEAFAMHVKGMELGAYDPRMIKGMAMVYACGPRGGCHHAGGRTLPLELDVQKYDRFAEAGKADLTKSSRDQRTAVDSLILCAFTMPSMPLTAKLLTAATGRSYTPQDLTFIGERISNLERAFNAREGLRRKDDSLPKRLLTEAATGGPSSPVNLDLMLDEFYQLCGWDRATGVPLRAKLEQLGLADVARDLDGTASAGDQ
jgi:aldehyde:ferredoxin oxidoreductase